MLLQQQPLLLVITAVGFLLLLRDRGVSAFGITTPEPSRFGRRAVATGATKGSASEPHHIAFDAGGHRIVDKERAKACAEHFGECSLEEIEQLRDGTCVGVGGWPTARVRMLCAMSSVFAVVVRSIAGPGLFDDSR